MEETTNPTLDSTQLTHDEALDPLMSSANKGEEAVPAVSSSSRGIASSLGAFLAFTIRVILIFIVLGALHPLLSFRREKTEHCLVASQSIASREISVPLSIHRLVVDLPHPTKVVINQGDHNSAKIVGHENVLGHIKFLEGSPTGFWVLALEPKFCVEGLTQLQVTVQTPHLEQIIAPGGAHIVATIGSPDYTRNFSIVNYNSEASIQMLNYNSEGSLQIQLKNVNVVRTNLGAGSVAISGACNTHEVQLLGSGNLNAFDFQTQNTSVFMTGSGRADIAVNHTLQVVMEGTGDVEYMGSPVVTIERMEATDTGTVNQVEI